MTTQYQIAWDNNPDDPNPHAWELDSEVYDTFEAAHKDAEAQYTEAAQFYGDGVGGFLIVSSTYEEATATPTRHPARRTMLTEDEQGVEAVLVAADRLREAYEAMVEGRDVGWLPDWQRGEA